MTDSQTAEAPVAQGHTAFVYVTFIKTTPETLWTALTDPAWIRRYWFGMTCESAWTPGSPWRLLFEDGRVADAGEILQAEPGRKLVIRWRNAFKPEFAAEGEALCTMEIEPIGDAVKLTVLHEIDVADSKFINAGVSNGWPRILSNLKSLLETGEVVLPI